MLWTTRQIPKGGSLVFLALLACGACTQTGPNTPTTTPPSPAVVAVTPTPRPVTAPPATQPPAPAPTPAPTAPPSANAAMTWTISDGCSDGRGLQVKFYDRTNGGVWPTSSTHYLASPGGSVVRTLSCTRGARICFGATTDPSTTTYWGIGLEGNRGCDSCCNACADVSVSRNLTCSSGASITSGPAGLPD
jgi:hypothetical protein